MEGGNSWEVMIESVMLELCFEGMQCYVLVLVFVHIYTYTSRVIKTQNNKTPCCVSRTDKVGRNQRSI